jgi:predicted metal-dependent hydrolase
MKYLLSLGGTPVEYTLERKRVKNINLRVRGGEVFVSAARWVPRDVIEQFLLSRAGLILRAVEQSAPPRERRWVSGERLFYLGRELTLCVEKGSQSRVTAQGDLLRVEVRETGNAERVERALAAWYRAESERLCREACDRLYPRFAPLGVPRPEIRMRAMRSCWGNCRPAKKVVTFNARLAAVPEDCVEYVVAHELTHFLHADHSPAFYAALARVIPDWKARRRELRAFAALLND